MIELWNYEATISFWFALLVRVLWIAIASKATWIAWHEHQLNKDAYQGGRYLRDGKRIIRRGRFRRSRWFLVAFTIALVIGWFATIGYIFNPPVVDSRNWIQVITAIAIVVMLYAFEQAKETDADMRAEAREYKRITGERHVEERVGEEIVHPPIDLRDQAEQDLAADPDDVGGDVDSIDDKFDDEDDCRSKDELGKE